jgi:acyl-CoA synthetase (NDP forming)
MAPLTVSPEARGHALSRMMSPRSIVILGMSARDNTAGRAVLRNLRANEFAGDIHLVGRTPGVIDDLPVMTSSEALPHGIDVAVLALPAAGIGEALTDCATRGIGGAVVFASGFAEAGDAARMEQRRIGQLVRDAGLVVLGPNCIGYANHVDGFAVAFAGVSRIPRVEPGRTDAVAIVGQSGGLANHLRLGLLARGVPVSYNVSTGNEMDLGLGDFVDYFVADAATRVIMIYAEHIRDPQAFLAAAHRAGLAEKPIVMIHPGRSARAKDAALSHTGALAGDYEVMRTLVRRAGIVLVETLDELLDTGEILSRYPHAGGGGMGILTLSGAFCGIAHDLSETLDFELPPLSAGSVEKIGARLTAHIKPKNPLDLGTQPIWEPDLIGIGLDALFDEPAIGGIAISIPSGASATANSYLANIVPARRRNDKPLVLAILGDASPLPPDFVQTTQDNGIILSRSSDRSLRALAHVLARREVPKTAAPAQHSLPDLALPAEGPLAEWRGKELLAALDIAVPKGRLATSLEDAQAAAEAIGYPVVLKAQADALAHKTEAGAVMLNIADAHALRTAWETLHANVAKAQPGLRLDGVLVEQMSPRGLELVVGARRDPQWGPVLLVGLGGILVEALHDVRLLAVDVTADEVLAELQKLKTAKLLNGFRNMPAVDVAAVADVVVKLGRLMQAEPSIVEIDVNPLMVHPVGQGAVALDALVVIGGGDRNAE